LDLRNIFAGSHAEHQWICSKGNTLYNVVWVKINKKLTNILSKMTVTQHSILPNIMRLANPQHTLTPVLHWLYVLIGPGGLLLVDSDLLLS
jgi:hypothetical protein